MEPSHRSGICFWDSSLMIKTSTSFSLTIRLLDLDVNWKIVMDLHMDCV